MTSIPTTFYMQTAFKLFGVPDEGIELFQTALARVKGFTVNR